MTCDQCGAANQAHTGFCPSCGATMQPSPTGDWSSAPNSQEVPPAVAPMAPAQTLVPVYGGTVHFAAHYLGSCCWWRV